MAGVKGQSGGHHSGAGRKPDAARVIQLHGSRDRGAVRMPAPVVVPCPEGLRADVAAVWAELSPHAAQMGTLAPSTSTAFLRLCQSVVKHAEMERQIEKDGLTYLKVSVDGAGVEHTEVKAHPLIARAQTLDNAIRSGLKDFAINPFGKPLLAVEAPQDEWAEFERPGA